MFQFFGPCVATLSALGFLAGTFCPLARAEDPRGRQLFAARWAAHDNRSPQGDGLGPMHNATSCAACHHQAGAGGGGDRQHNVELLSVVPVDPDQARSGNFIQRLTTLHPGFKVGNGNEIRPNIVLHRFGAEGDYFDFRAKLLGIEEPRADVDPAKRAVLAVALAKRRKNLPPVETLPPVEGISFKLSQRNTPPLWGDGLIDAIADTVIKEVADRQKKETPEVAGRVPRATGGGVGRFGWRGQTASLRQFVTIACANELGLQTKDNPQPVNPLGANYQLTGQDMSDADVDAMVKFVDNLPRPLEAQPAKGFSAESVRQGEAVFTTIGCAVCHPREMGKINGFFSDMLLHDMGKALADPVEPNPDVDLVERKSFGGYSGGGTIFVEKERRDPSLPQQWRTPPLWGVSDSGPYLHDGRAETLLAAIVQHGGQAAGSAAKFRELPSSERTSVLAFLETLKAPPHQQGK
jgi:CxxC motif-containing protein (DUF1111 family)